MKMRSALAALASIVIVGSAAAPAGAVNYQWFNGIVHPNETRYESSGFAKTTSTAAANSGGNSAVRLICYLGSATAVGNETCNLNLGSPTYQRAGFKYEYMWPLVDWAVNVRAEIQGIPGGPMSDDVIDSGTTTTESTNPDRTLGKTQRWTDGNWTLSTENDGNGRIRVTLGTSEVTGETTGSLKKFESQGISIAVDDGEHFESFVVFPRDRRLDDRLLANTSVEQVAPGVVRKTSHDKEPVIVKTGGNLTVLY